jgi:hypothetical protein
MPDDSMGDAIDCPLYCRSIDLLIRCDLQTLVSIGPDAAVSEGIAACRPLDTYVDIARSE